MMIWSWMGSRVQLTVWVMINATGAGGPIGPHMSIYTPTPLQSTSHATKVPRSQGFKVPTWSAGPDVSASSLKVLLREQIMEENVPSAYLPRRANPREAAMVAPVAPVPTPESVSQLDMSDASCPSSAPSIRFRIAKPSLS